MHYDGYRYKDIISRTAPPGTARSFTTPRCSTSRIPTAVACLPRFVSWAHPSAKSVSGHRVGQGRGAPQGLHFRGEHRACGNGDLPADHPVVRCDARRRYLAEVLLSLAECICDVLTPVGAINTESLHAVHRRHRPKGEKWGVVHCFLGLTMGFLHWQRLHIGFWQPECCRNPMLELAQLIEAELSISVPLDKRDLEDMEQRLQAAVEAKEARLHPSWKARRAQRKAERLRYAAQSAASSTYQGGQLAAGRSAVWRVDIDVCGTEDGGVGLDPPETKGEWHAPGMFPAGPQQGDFEVEVEGGYAGGLQLPLRAVAPDRCSTSNRAPDRFSLIRSLRVPFFL